MPTPLMHGAVHIRFGDNRTLSQLKQLAVDYLHPEKSVVTSDPFAMGRNFFTRPSAEEYEEDPEECSHVLADAAALKKLAVDYLHPEKPVETDAFARGRNYFSRLSAEGYDNSDLASDMDRSLEDASQLKKLAVDYLHPEKPVETTDPAATGRNYFDRGSAAGHAEHIHTQGTAIGKVEHAPVVNDVHTYEDDAYYHYHVDDHLHSDHQDQSDHFDMDEDMAHEFRDFQQSLHTMVPLKGAAVPKEDRRVNTCNSNSEFSSFHLARRVNTCNSNSKFSSFYLARRRVNTCNSKSKFSSFIVVLRPTHY
jgi:hypothetical protein